MSSERCVPVPVALLERVVNLSSCAPHGQWCWEHEDQPWPCPLARLRQYLPCDDAQPIPANGAKP